MQVSTVYASDCVCVCMCVCESRSSQQQQSTFESECRKRVTKGRG